MWSPASSTEAGHYRAEKAAAAFVVVAFALGHPVKALKAWQRKWKLDLIGRTNPGWEDLFLTLNA